jgi:crossover junction endodeoxyribonuclease RuvC
VKKTIIGAGHGEKAQIRMMVGVLLPKADPQSHDAADALAIAVCHAHHRQSPLSSLPRIRGRVGWGKAAAR